LIKLLKMELLKLGSLHALQALKNIANYVHNKNLNTTCMGLEVNFIGERKQCIAGEEEIMAF